MCELWIHILACNVCLHLPLTNWTLEREEEEEKNRHVVVGRCGGIGTGKNEQSTAFYWVVVIYEYKYSKLSKPFSFRLSHEAQPIGGIRFVLSPIFLFLPLFLLLLFYGRKGWVFSWLDTWIMDGWVERFKLYIINIAYLVFFLSRGYFVWLDQVMKNVRNTDG